MKLTVNAMNLIGSLNQWWKNPGLLLASLLFAGCPAGKPTTGSGSDAASTSGSTNAVVIRGSNTIGEELAPRLIAEFKKQHPTITFELEPKATGYGMAALRAGKCDIAAASRAAIVEELELTKEAGIEMNDYVLGAYSVAVVVNAANPVANLTKDQVRGIFTGTIQNWKDVGGSDAAIHIYARDPVSGTYLGFKEVAMNNESYALHSKLLTSYQGIDTAIAGDADGIGYTGITLAKDPTIKLVSVDGIEPSSAAVLSGKYPYARALRFYTNKAKESQPAKDFIEYVLSAPGQQILVEMGFTPKP